MSILDTKCVGSYPDPNYGCITAVQLSARRANYNTQLYCIEEGNSWIFYDKMGKYNNLVSISPTNNRK